MTRGFWNDPARHMETYWERIPGPGSMETGQKSR